MVVRVDGVIHRYVRATYRPHYEHLMSSGLYESLVADGLLVAHEEVTTPSVDGVWRVLRPDAVPFVSYPYEWCPGQLLDAARLTLRVQGTALAHGMSLKDASAYNVQFVDGRPLFIDTLSFERCEPGEPWVGYRQFCEHFLAPLALVRWRDARLGGLLRVWPDGIPLDLTSALLPWRTRWRWSLLAHVHLHAASQRRFAGRPVTRQGRRLRPTGVLALVESLGAAVERAAWTPAPSAWSDYYVGGSYTEEGRADKDGIVARYLDRLAPRTVWDLGANTGRLSRIASERKIRTVAFDADPAAVELAYRGARERDDRWLLPLVMDLVNPSAPLGWRGRERMGLTERGPADVVLALAIVHHLALGHALPLAEIAAFLADVGRHAIVEFVPKTDPQAQRLLASRDDVFPDYTRDAFEAVVSPHFVIEDVSMVTDSSRTLYLLRKRT
jgi:hypothetical protein